MASLGLESLPPEIIHLILSHLPVLDFFSLKLAGSRYISHVIRACRRLSRGKYILAIEDEYAQRNSGRHRSAMEITIARGQHMLMVDYIEKRYQQMSTSKRSCV